MRKIVGEYPVEAGWYWFCGTAGCRWSVVEVYQDENGRWMYARDSNLVDSGIFCEAVDKDTIYIGPIPEPTADQSNKSA